MRVLLANHHLLSRSGSELVCLEIGTALIERGHSVGVFTFHRGPISDALAAAGAQVFTPHDVEALRAFKPDILHVHHASCLAFLGALGLDAACVHSCLGALPALEAPPPVWAGVALGLAVSEEVRDRMAASPFGEAVPLAINRNWFDDRGLARPEPSARPVRRVAVVTNHLEPRLAAALDARGVAWTHIGAPNNVKVVDAQTLLGFDAVVTIGRTAILAGALGLPCLLADVHGSDGALTPETFDALASVNFSGRHKAGPITLDALLGDAVDLSAVQDRVWRDHRLSDRVAWLEETYARLAKGTVRMSAATARAYGAVGKIHAEQAEAIDDLQGRLAPPDSGVLQTLLKEQLGRVRAALTEQS